MPWGLRSVSGTLCLLLVAACCRNSSTTGELASPADAAPFDGEYARAYDDDFTRQAVHLTGRAPNDVLDQQLFSERLGFANLLATVTVQEAFGRGRYDGRKDQYLAVEIEEVLMGSLPRGTELEQLLLVRGEDPLPADLSGARLLLFVRWAPEETPSYHHHLMPADEEMLAVIGAMLNDAKAQGVLEEDGEIASGRKTRRCRRRGA